MTTYLGKSCSFGLPRVPFVNCRQFMYLVISLLVLRAGCGIWLYQFLIIVYLFTFRDSGNNIYTGFYRHAWDVLDQLAKPTFHYWSRNRVKNRWTQASRDVPPPVLGFDGGISLVIAVKMLWPHKNHVLNHWVIARYVVRARTMFCTIFWNRMGWSLAES